jgi:hypothetical protein
VGQRYGTADLNIIRWGEDRVIGDAVKRCMRVLVASEATLQEP